MHILPNTSDIFYNQTHLNETNKHIAFTQFSFLLSDSTITIEFAIRVNSLYNIKKRH